MIISNRWVTHILTLLQLLVIFLFIIVSSVIRYATGDDVIAFLKATPIQSNLKELLIQEMQFHIGGPPNPSSLNLNKKSTSNMDTDTDVPMAPSHIKPPSKNPRQGKVSPSRNERRYFSHYLYWGGYVVCGQGNHN
jgi:hypothetical protein